MSVFNYTATRRLSPGTNSMDVVDREFRLVSKRRKESAKGKQNTALGGATETLLYRSEVTYACTTGLIDPGSMLEKQIVEFLASVQAGEQFNFDREGSLAQADEVVSCVMFSNNVIEEKEAGKKFHRYAMTFREN